MWCREVSGVFRTDDVVKRSEGTIRVHRSRHVVSDGESCPKVGHGWCVAVAPSTTSVSSFTPSVRRREDFDRLFVPFVTLGLRVRPEKFRCLRGVPPLF